jgi:HAD superfamily hydrolase (TIGR01509 family)
VSDPQGALANAAVLFDMDGLLIDSEPLWLESETAVMARLGADWTERDQAALLGGSLNRTVRYLLAKASRPAPPEAVAEWLMSGIIARVRRGGVPVRPGARELLAATAAAGLPTALVTSSERSFMDAVLASTGLRFGALVCADDVTATKPDPEPYLLAAKLLGVPSADCFALEDSPNGVASAEAAGCQVIAVPSLVPIPAAPGRTVVGSLLDLTADADGIRVRGLAPQTSRQLPPRLLHESHGEVRMSTYDKIAWLPLCGGLTGLGLVLSYLAMRRRGLGSGLRGAAWSLLPLAAYLTGAIEMFWRMGAAVGDFAKGFAFSVEVWSGIVVAGVAVVLFVASGPLRRRVKQGQGRQEVGSASSAGKAAPAGRRELAARPPAAGATAPAPVPAKARKGKGAAGDDDDLGDVEDILRRHGIT